MDDSRDDQDVIDTRSTTGGPERRDVLKSVVAGTAATLLGGAAAAASDSAERKPHEKALDHAMAQLRHGAGPWRIKDAEITGHWGKFKKDFESLIATDDDLLLWRARLDDLFLFSGALAAFFAATDARLGKNGKKWSVGHPAGEIQEKHIVSALRLVKVGLCPATSTDVHELCPNPDPKSAVRLEPRLKACAKHDDLQEPQLLVTSTAMRSLGYDTERSGS